MIGDAVLNRDVVPVEITVRPVANVEPIFRLDRTLFDSLENQGFIDVIFAMCAGDGNETSEQWRRDTKIAAPRPVRHGEKNCRQKRIHKFPAAAFQPPKQKQLRESLIHRGSLCDDHRESVRRLFLISVWIKGTAGLLETIVGVPFFFITPRAIEAFVVLLTAPELSEDPNRLDCHYPQSCSPALFCGYRAIHRRLSCHSRSHQDFPRGRSIAGEIVGLPDIALVPCRMHCP